MPCFTLKNNSKCYQHCSLCSLDQAASILVEQFIMKVLQYLYIYIITNWLCSNIPVNPNWTYFLQLQLHIKSRNCWNMGWLLYWRSQGKCVGKWAWYRPLSLSEMHLQNKTTVTLDFFGQLISLKISQGGMEQEGAVTVMETDYCLISLFKQQLLILLTAIILDFVVLICACCQVYHEDTCSTKICQSHAVVLEMLILPLQMFWIQHEN